MRHFHPVAPAFPSQAPGAEGGALPVVLDEAHVMQLHVDADRGERIEVERLQVLGARLQDHLILIIVLQPVGVLAVAPVLGPARRLNVSRLPGLASQRAQGRRRVKRARAHLHVVGLQHDAATGRPVRLEREDEALKRLRRVEAGVFGGRHGAPSLELRAPMVNAKPVETRPTLPCAFAMRSLCR